MYLNFHIVKTYCIYLIRHLVVVVVVERGGVVAGMEGHLFKAGCLLNSPPNRMGTLRVLI